MKTERIAESGITYEVETDTYGTKEWYLNGKQHRVDGPAVEYANGTKSWYLNGKRHRVVGPAVERADGTKAWYLNGEELIEEEFHARAKSEKRAPKKERSFTVKQVTAYQTDDGNFFPTKVSAERHNFEEQFHAAIAEHAQCSKADADKLLDKLIELKLVKYPGRER